MSGLPPDLQLDPRVNVSNYDDANVYETWESVDRLSALVSDFIEESGEHFDHAIIIGRGGFGPGNIIVRRLGFHGSEVIHLGMNSYDAIETEVVAKGLRQQGRLRVGQLPSHSHGVHGKRGLIIDEVSDTGDSLNHARKLLQEAGFSVVKTAVLHWKNLKGPRPDYFAKIANGWIHYPWEPHDLYGEEKHHKAAAARLTSGGPAK
jgi:hypoxanthine phosphoribosyltransferase